MSSDKEMGSRPVVSLGPHYSFMGLPQDTRTYDAARAVIVPVPYDGTTTFRAGTREGPRAILAASRELEPYDEEILAEPYQAGIATLEEPAVTVASPREMVSRVRRAGEAVLEAGKMPVLLGGEHLLSLGMIQAVVDHFPKVTVLHLDAHADLKEEYQESAYSNACIMRHVHALAPLVQVGIRSLTREEHAYIREADIPCFWAHTLHDDPSWVDRVVSCLGQEVYISIDLDGLDPSIMPAVGTPEPGGLGWYEVLRLLRRVAMTRRVVGFDVMELLPVPYQVAADFLAARLVYKLIGYIFMDNRAA